MAAVYSSLLSLVKVINLAENPSLPLVYLKKLQTQPLLDQVNILLEFVEYFSHYTRRTKEIELLESRITVEAHKAEYIIETFVVDQVKRKSAECRSTVDSSHAISCENLDKVVNELDQINEEMSKIQVDYKEMNQQKQQQVRDSTQASSGSSTSTMVGFDEDLTKLMEKLTNTSESGRQVIPITGMGGLGKTTLATHTYNHPFIKSCFDTRAWVTVSQHFSLRNTLLCLLNESDSKCRVMSDQELGVKLHKFLFGRKYLVVLDNIWSMAAWDEISKFLPDDGNRSRIMMTTRLSVSALSLGSSIPYQMKFLDQDVSWNLLSSKVFGGQGEQAVCPPELEEIGRVIAKKCRGLPLAIVVIGGLLKVSDKSRDYWSEVAENVSSIVNRENDEQCLRILYLSYNQLPIHLKPLFLYIAIFPEDFEVKVSTLVKLWVAEGFIKQPTDINKTMEKVAKEYLKDLCDRNLIMIKDRSFSGNMKTFKIHDLLRDVSLREAHKERFLCVLKNGEGITENTTSEHRLGLHPKSWHKYESVTFPSTPHDIRTVFGENVHITSDVILSFDLLRVLHVDDLYTVREIFALVNARYLAFLLSLEPKLTSYLPWNLESVFIKENIEDIYLPSEIWQMQHLRHVESTNLFYFPNPDEETNQYCVLRNLQTLSILYDFKFTVDILGRIPNLRKLYLGYEVIDPEEVIAYIQNVARLQKLEILKLYLTPSIDYNLKNLCFPLSLRKLSLECTRIPWEKMDIVGSLPKLEKLELLDNAFVGREWITNEGEFQCLKTLKFIEINELKIWEVEGIHFPALEHLLFQLMGGLKEIPWGVREIPALKLIQLDRCMTPLYISAKEMLLEVQDEGNDDLVIKVITWKPDAKIQALVTHNFQVEVE